MEITRASEQWGHIREADYTDPPDDGELDGMLSGPSVQEGLLATRQANLGWEDEQWGDLPGGQRVRGAEPKTHRGRPLPEEGDYGWDQDLMDNDYRARGGPKFRGEAARLGMIVTAAGEVQLPVHQWDADNQGPACGVDQPTHVTSQSYQVNCPECQVALQRKQQESQAEQMKQMQQSQMAVMGRRRLAKPDDELIGGGATTGPDPKPAPSTPSGSHEPGGDTVFPKLDSGTGQPGGGVFPMHVQPGGESAGQGAGAGAIDRTAPGLGGADAAPKATPGLIGDAAAPGGGSTPDLIGDAAAPTPGGGTPPAGGTTTPGGSTGTGAGGQSGTAGGAASGAPSSIGPGQYTVQEGDTLSGIADSAGMGGDYQSLADSNSIADPNHIETGQTIDIPGGASGGAGASPPAGSPASGAGAGPAPGPAGGDLLGPAVDPGNVSQSPGLIGDAQSAASPAAPAPMIGTGQDVKMSNRQIEAWLMESVRPSEVREGDEIHVTRRPSEVATSLPRGNSAEGWGARGRVTRVHQVPDEHGGGLKFRLGGPPSGPHDMHTYRDDDDSVEIQRF